MAYWYFLTIKVYVTGFTGLGTPGFCWGEGRMWYHACVAIYETSSYLLQPLASGARSMLSPMLARLLD